MLTMGAVAGMLAGLLGIGGGIIIVPVLALVFEMQGIDINVLMHAAIGTSLATIVVTSLSSVRTHHRHRAINWSVVRVITVGVVAGGLAGAGLASFIPGKGLKIIFSVFVLLIAAQMYFGNSAKPHRALPGAIGIISAGSVIGIISSLLGVGGGSMSVPFLTWCNVNIRSAVATSSAIGFPIALAGTVGFTVSGWDISGRPVMSIGYVNLPAFFSIVIASVVFAPVGARFAHHISPILLKRIFAAFLLVLGVRMILS